MDARFDTYFFSISLPAITVIHNPSCILSGTTTSGFSIWANELSVPVTVARTLSHSTLICSFPNTTDGRHLHFYDIVSINMGIFRAQPLLSEEFTHALSRCPRRLSRVKAVTGGLSGRHRSSSLFDLVTPVSRLCRESHTLPGAAMGRN